MVVVQCLLGWFQISFVKHSHIFWPYFLKMKTVVIQIRMAVPFVREDKVCAMYALEKVV